VSNEDDSEPDPTSRERTDDGRSAETGSDDREERHRDDIDRHSTDDSEPAVDADEKGVADSGEREQRIERREQRLEEREQRLEERERELDQREEQIERREETLDERAVRIDEQESAVEERIEEFEQQREREDERLDRAVEQASGTPSNRTPAAGGILLMFVGVVTAIAGVGLLAAVATGIPPLSINFDFGAMAAVGLLGAAVLGEITASGATVLLNSATVILGLGATALVLAALLVAGGWQAFQRKHWFFSLVTGILALLLIFPLGLLAIFLITVGERQFAVE
jgi:hypothetical protein